MTLPTYPDADAVVARWLADQQDIQQWSREDAAPTNTAQWMPFVWVRGFGRGGIGADTFDRPTLDVDWFASSDEAVRALASAGRSLLLYSLPGYHEPGLTIARVAEQARPGAQYWSESVYRRSGTYSLIVQPH